MSDAPWWERIEEGRRVELGFIRLDRVGSARDFEGLTREQALARRAGYQLLVTDWARGYGAVEPIGWQGDGAMIFVGDGGPAQVRDGEEFNSAASRAGLLAVELLQQLLVIGYSVRIAAGCGRVPFHRETGRMGGPDIDRTGHLEHDAPADSAALTEDVYLALPVAMRERCGYLGTTLRDGTVCYVVPATAVKRADGSRFHKEDPERERQRFLRYVESPDVQRLRYVGLKLGRKAPPSLPLLEVFRPLLVVEQERSPPPLPEDPAAPEGEEVLPWRRERSRSKPRPFTDLFREGRRCVVLGDPGSGKSTLLRWLAIIAARGRAACRNNLGVDERMLPVLASVGRLAELRSKLDAAGGAGGASVIEALAAYFHERNAGEESGRLAEFLEKRLSEGGCLLLLDGLDEVAGDRMEVRRWLETFCAAFSQNRFVVTSRSVGYAGFDIPGATRTVVVEPFDEEQVRDYLREWNRSYRAWESNLTPWQREADRPKADAEANEIARLLLGQRGRLGALARNPFLLSGIALVHRSEGRLPPYRVKLYEIFAEALCETWNRARRLGGGDAGAALDYRAEGIPVLGSLAYWMHEHHPTGTAPAADVRNKIAEALVEEIGVAQQEADKASARFLERASDELQLLVPRGPEAFGFLHLTFQEFFAAAYLHSKERFATEALAHWIDPRWEEVILLGTGYMSIIQGRPSAAAAFVRDLMSAEHGWITEVLGKQLFVAFKAVADAPNLAADLHTEVAERFLGRVFDDPLLAGSTPHEVSTTLAHARETPLGGAVVRRLVEFLTPSAGRGTPPRASSAARALGALGDAQAVDPLLAALRDPDEIVRWAAAEALGALGDARAVEPLLAAVRDPAGHGRGAAAQALGALGDGRAVEPLLAALRDPDDHVRGAAAQALGALGDGRAVEPLLAALRDERWGHGNIAFNALWRLSLLPSVWKAAIRRKRTPKRPATARTRRQPQSRKRKKR